VSAPFSRRSLAPLAGSSAEILVSGGAYCIELERGAQPGTRLGFERAGGDALSVPFDAPGCSVLASGQERFWIHWPATVDATRVLELTSWTVQGRYTRLSGNEKAMPLVHVLTRDEASPGAGGSTTFGPWNVTPYAQIADLSHLRLSRGARLVVEAGGSIGAVGTMDVRIEERVLDGGGFRMIDGKRGTGVPSLPAGELFASFDRPAPLGDFRVVIAYSAAATIWLSVYLLLGP
jgi:hypothetical protein